MTTEQALSQCAANFGSNLSPESEQRLAEYTAKERLEVARKSFEHASAGLAIVGPYTKSIESEIARRDKANAEAELRGAEIQWQEMQKEKNERSRKVGTRLYYRLRNHGRFGCYYLASP